MRSILSAILLSICLYACAAAPALAGQVPESLRPMRDATVMVTTITATGIHSGSGVVISTYQVLTAKHVTDGSGGTVFLKFANGKSLRGTVLWSNADLDLAIVGTSIPETISPATVECGPLTLGEPVTAFGFPLYGSWVMTSGRVASIDGRRVASPDQSVVMDLTINNGNSGGPVFNEKGRLIGIARAFLDSNGMGSQSGLSLVIPAERFCAVLPSGIVKVATSDEYAIIKPYRDAFGQPVDWRRWLSPIG